MLIYFFSINKSKTTTNVISSRLWDHEDRWLWLLKLNL